MFIVQHLNIFNTLFLRFVVDFEYFWGTVFLDLAVSFIPTKRFIPKGTCKISLQFVIMVVGVLNVIFSPFYEIMALFCAIHSL